MSHSWHLKWSLFANPFIDITCFLPHCHTQCRIVLSSWMYPSYSSVPWVPYQRYRTGYRMGLASIISLLKHWLWLGFASTYPSEGPPAWRLVVGACPKWKTQRYKNNINRLWRLIWKRIPRLILRHGYIIKVEVHHPWVIGTHKKHDEKIPSIPMFLLGYLQSLIIPWILRSL